MRIICNHEQGGVQIWSSVALSISPLSLSLDFAVKNPGKSVNEVVMKLAKKNNLPVLSFEIFGTTHMGRRVKVAHDVRIEVMKPADVALLTEPRCPEPDVRFIRLA